MGHDLIEENRGLKEPVLTVLTSMVQLAREARAAQGEAAEPGAEEAAEPGTDEEDAEVRVDRSAVENAAQARWKDGYRHTPALTVDILVRNKALDLTTLVNGEPYDGTLEDIQLDLSIPDDATAVCDLALTAYGRAILQEYRPETLLAHLLAQKGAYEPVFDAILAACAAKDSCTRPELEDVVDGFPELTHADGADEQQTVYAQFFLDTLEEAGGIAWDDGWKITEAGRALLEEKQAGAQAS